MIKATQSLLVKSHATPADNTLRLGLDQLKEILSACISGNIQSVCYSILEEKAVVCKAVVSLQDDRTFENTVVPLDRAGLKVTLIQKLFEALDRFAKSEDRDRALETPWERSPSSLPTAEEILLCLNQLIDTGRVESRSVREKKATNWLINAYNGDGTRSPNSLQTSEAQQINDRLSELGELFNSNAISPRPDKYLHIYSESELQGFSEHAIAVAKQEALDRGLDGWCVVYDNPVFWGWSSELRQRDTREAMIRMCDDAASVENLPIIEEILELRRKKARLQGFRNYVELVNKNEILKTAEEIEALLTAYEEVTCPHAERELKELQQFGSAGDYSIDQVKSWDLGFLRAERNRARQSINSQPAPLFNIDSSVTALFGLAKDLFDIEIQEIDLPRWDPSVSSFQAKDPDGRVLGTFYLDLLHRSSKTDRLANLCTLYTNLDGDNSQTGHIAILFCTIGESGGTPGTMTYSELKTFCHEFGHLMHLLMSRPEFHSERLSSRVTAEIISRFFENFALEKDIFSSSLVNRVASPQSSDEVFERLKQQEDKELISQIRGLLTNAFIDNGLHSTYHPSLHQSAMDFAVDQDKRVRLVFPSHVASLLSSNLHIFTEEKMAGVYSSYLQSEIFAADLHSEFKRTSRSADFGARLRKHFFEPADSQDTATLLQNTLGREPNTRVLLSRIHERM